MLGRPAGRTACLITQKGFYRIRFKLYFMIKQERGLIFTNTSVKGTFSSVNRFSFERAHILCWPRFIWRAILLVTNFYTSIRRTEPFGNDIL